MVGLVLALAVVAIIVSLVGQWIVGIAIGAVAIVVFVIFVTRFGRKAASPPSPKARDRHYRAASAIRARAWDRPANIARPARTF